MTKEIFKEIVRKGKIFQIILCEKGEKLFNSYKWHISRSQSKEREILYLRRHNSKAKITTVYFHRELLNYPSLTIDHINGNTLDNRLKNLRLATHSQNRCNQQKRRINNTSGYVGVTKNKSKNKWDATVWYNYKNYYVGSYATREEAAMARNGLAEKLHGEFVVLNSIQNN